MDLLDRPRYIGQIEQWLGKGLAIVLTGQRRIGKSMCLKLVANKYEGGNNVIYIDKEDHSFDGITDYISLNNYIESKYSSSHHNYILIDEIPDIEGFEHSVRSWIKKPDTDVIITGSNAKMLSSDLSTMLAARYKEINIHSLSYIEFLKFHNLPDTDDSLQKFLTFGGLPFLRIIGIDNTQQIVDYIKGVYDTIVLKDIIQRESIRNTAFLINLAKFLSDNIGKPISPNNIMNYMKSKGDSVSAQLVLSYLTYYTNAYLAYRVYRYNIHGKTLLENNEKYYFDDLGIRNTLIRSTSANDIEKRIENVIYMHLLRCGWSISVGQLYNAEIDFVAEKAGETMYIQTTYIIASEDTERREFGNLLAIRDNHRKLVVSMTPFNTKSSYQGIDHLSLREFLTTEW